MNINELVNYDLFDNKEYIEDLRYVNQYIGGHFDEKSVLITGATGLIGSFMTDALIYYNRNKEDKNKCSIYATGRDIKKLRNRFPYINDDDKVTFLEWNIGIISPREVFSIDFDYIIHAAGNSDPANFANYPVETIQANVCGINSILEYMRKKSGKCMGVFLSSRESYGVVKDSIYYKEDDFGLIDFNNIRSCYPESKRIAELLCRSYAKEYGVMCKIARLSYVYGPVMTSKDSKVIAQFIRQGIKGEDIVMKSAGSQVRSYGYVADMADGIFRILLSKAKDIIYNVANSQAEISIRDMANKIAKILNVKVIYENPSDEENGSYSIVQDAKIDESRLISIGYNPIYDFDRGIRRTINIYKDR